MSLDLLPDDCFAHIISLTSPNDACRLSLVSLSVYSIANLDSLWMRFLPSDYREILTRFVDPVVFSSNKELFMRLCSPRLIDGGKKVKCLVEIKCTCFGPILIVSHTQWILGEGFLKFLAYEITWTCFSNTMCKHWTFISIL